MEEIEAECDSAWKTWKAATADLEALPEYRLSAEQRYTLLHRQDKQAQATKRLAQLQAAMHVLVADIEASQSAAQILNDCVFEQLVAVFGQTMAAALPGFEFRAERVSEHADDGVRIVFRRAAGQNTLEPKAKRQRTSGGEIGAVRGNSSVSGIAGSDGDWKVSLQELSGGQRSLCSLAFILAATQAGAAPTMMLVDEVDAALDEVNQTRVGDMLQQCSKRSRMQVWAVSHSTSFHGWCDTFIKVKQESSGRSTVAEVSAAPKQSPAQ